MEEKKKSVLLLILIVILINVFVGVIVVLTYVPSKGEQFYVHIENKYQYEIKIYLWVDGKGGYMYIDASDSSSYDPAGVTEGQSHIVKVSRSTAIIEATVNVPASKSVSFIFHTNGDVTYSTY